MKEAGAQILLYSVMLPPIAIILKSILSNDLLYTFKGVTYLIFTASLLFMKGYGRNNLIVQITFWASIIAIIGFDLLVYML